MGLDNIPHVYPCKKAGTAITVRGEGFDGETVDKIDCDATIKAGQCPWATAAEGRGIAVTGMFGTPCWYRGKAGTWMLERLEAAGAVLPLGVTSGFYGEKAERLNPEYCTTLATFMDENADRYTEALVADPQVPDQYVEEEVDQYRYAAWWLRWIAEAGDGADSWW